MTKSSESTLMWIGAGFLVWYFYMKRNAPAPYAGDLPGDDGIYY
jgi:hypothetical protein